MSEPCTDRNCQRERGHAGMHMSRAWDAMNCMEIIDEWGDMTAEQMRAAIKMHDDRAKR